MCAIKSCHKQSGALVLHCARYIWGQRGQPCSASMYLVHEIWPGSHHLGVPCLALPGFLGYLGFMLELDVTAQEKYTMNAQRTKVPAITQFQVRLDILTIHHQALLARHCSVHSTAHGPAHPGPRIDAMSGTPRQALQSTHGTP